MTFYYYYYIQYGTYTYLGLFLILLYRTRMIIFIENDEMQNTQFVKYIEINPNKNELKRSPSSKLASLGSSSSRFVRNSILF